MPYANPQEQKDYWRARSRRPEVKERNRLRKLARTPEQKAADAEYQRVYRNTNKAAVSAAKRRWERTNGALVRERKRPYTQQYNRQYAAKNKEALRPYKTAWCAARRARIARATPGWADDVAITAIYKLAAERGMHVDHRVPINSKRVCGLHCEANLQPLPGVENCRKGNRTWPDMP